MYCPLATACLPLTLHCAHAPRAGEQSADGRHAGRRAHTSRGLPACVRDPGQEGAAVDGHVRLQQAQRSQLQRERLAPEQGARPQIRRPPPPPATPAPAPHPRHIPAPSLSRAPAPTLASPSPHARGILATPQPFPSCLSLRCSVVAA
eukprot:4624233-Pleurochrysis_carterae.AAC.2